MSAPPTAPPEDPAPTPDRGGEPRRAPWLRTVPRRAADLLARQWPALLLCAFACWLIWPGPIGRMPLSQDHTVHVARAWMVGEELRSGHLSGWSSYWYFGFPVGELYPVLGDLFVGLLRALSFGTLPWPQCYAFVFSAAYVLQGIAMLRISRATGLGRAPGFIGAVLLYLDPGVLREGGWAYTVHFGVWMQPVACVFIWWAFAELALLVRADDVKPRALVGPAVLVALAMLAHPIALPMAALGTLVMLVAQGVRANMPRVLVSFGLVTGVGAAMAAWWVLPMMTHSAWIANLGTLYSDMDTMLRRVWSGSWAKFMPASVGYAILVGLLWGVLRGNRFVRGLAVLAVVLWLMSTSDFFFRFRLDWLSENFRYLQYQRFIICAKPGLYLAAGLVPAVLGHAAWGLWRDRVPGDRGRVALAVGLTVAAALVTGSMLASAGDVALENGVGDYRTMRVQGDRRTDRDFAEFNAWAKKRWADRGGDYWRIAYKARRHSHIYADAPVFNGAPSYKIGYMPGEVFVHRPESEQAEVLDRLRVKYFVGASGVKDGKVIKRFGKIKVSEREVTEQIARVVGQGELEVLVDDVDHERVAVRVRGAAPGTRLEFNVAGFPRWQVLHDGVPVDWVEVPAVGNGPSASPEERRAGEFRTGKGNTTPPTDPMLLGVDAEDGVYELRWRRWMVADVIGACAFAAALGIAAALAFAPRRAAAVLARIEGWLRPWVLATLAAMFVVAALARYGSGFVAERHLASGHLREGRVASAHGVSNGPIKVDRVIGPAILVEASADDPATVALPGVSPATSEIPGWFAIDDHALKDATSGWEIVVDGRPSGDGDGEWQELRRVPIRSRSGKQDLALDIDRFADAARVDLRVSVRGRTGKTPRLGFDFDLR